MADESGVEDPLVAAWRAYLAQRGTEHAIHVVESDQGDGAALRAGLGQARHPLICYAPLSTDYPPEFLGRLLDRPFEIEDAPPDLPPGREIDHVHIVSGYRAGVRVPLALRLLGGLYRGVVWLVLSYAPHPLPGWLGWRRHLGGWLARWIFGVQYRDPCCPFRLLRREILARIPLQSDSAFAHVELIAKANFLGAVLSEEVPLEVRPGPYRGDGARFLREARRLFQRPDFGPTVLPETSHQSV